MSALSSSNKLAARVSVKVPQPDSLVEVRVTPPESDFEIKVGPGDDVIELLIRPGSSLIEVRISPPPARTETQETNPDQKASLATMTFLPTDPGPTPNSPDAPMDKPKVPGLEAAYVLPQEVINILEKDIDDEDEKSSETPVAALAEALATFGVADDDHHPANPEEEPPQAEASFSPMDMDLDLMQLPTDFNQAVLSAETSSPLDMNLSSLLNGVSPFNTDEANSTDQPDPKFGLPSAEATLGPIKLIGQSEGLPTPDDQKSPQVEAKEMALNSLVSEAESVAEPKVDSTVMVELYDDSEPPLDPSETVTPLPEDDLMDLSQVEHDDDLAIDPIDVAVLDDLDLEKSRQTKSFDGQPAIKAKPMLKVVPANTIVPE